MPFQTKHDFEPVTTKCTANIETDWTVFEMRISYKEFISILKFMLMYKVYAIKNNISTSKIDIKITTALIHLFLISITIYSFKSSLLHL